MKTILSNEYLLWINTYNDDGIIEELTSDKSQFNWSLFEIGDPLYLETELDEYEYTVEHINHEKQLIVLV